LSLSALALATAQGYPTLIAAALLAGAGNAVFHPADFTVLNRRVSTVRLGHAFSVHGLAGNIGWAAAPVFMTGIAAAAGWRNAALSAAVLGLVALTSVVLLRGTLGAPVPAHARAAADDGPRSSPFAFLRVGAVWMCFFFFLASIIGFGALQNFAPSVLSHVYGLPLTAAASALTLYLLGGAAGIIAGGFLAARYEAHERVVAALLVTAALMALSLATGSVPGVLVTPLMAVVGFCTGTATPSRDLLVRRAAIERFGQRSFGASTGSSTPASTWGSPSRPSSSAGSWTGGCSRPCSAAWRSSRAWRSWRRSASARPAWPARRRRQRSRSREVDPAHRLPGPRQDVRLLLAASTIPR